MTFEKITNFDENIGISVLNHQTYYIESVEECLNEAKYYDGWNAYKIVDDGEIIAFAMYGQFPEENNRVFLDRFFIDGKHQGKGYFRKITPLLIDKIVKEYNLKEIFISVFPDNLVALKLYQEIGFAVNGEKDLNGEVVMVKTV